MRAAAQKDHRACQPRSVSESSKSSKASIRDTVRKGLDLLSAKEAYAELRKMRGKLKISINMDKLRKDREW